MNFCDRPLNFRIVKCVKLMLVFFHSFLLPFRNNRNTKLHPDNSLSIHGVSWTIKNINDFFFHLRSLLFHWCERKKTIKIDVKNMAPDECRSGRFSRLSMVNTMCSKCIQFDRFRLEFLFLFISFFFFARCITRTRRLSDRASETQLNQNRIKLKTLLIYDVVDWQSTVCLPDHHSVAVRT